MKNASGLLYVLLVLGLPCSMSAGTIVYIDQTVASGFLGSVNFTNALVTVAVIGDTTTAHLNGNGQLLDDGPATVTVAGLGVANFNNIGTALVDTNGPGGSFRAGIAEQATTGTGSVLDTGSNVFSTYNLTTSIGPVIGTALFPPNLAFPTDLGNFHISSTAATSTFTATVATTLNNFPGGPSSAPVFLIGSTVGVVTGTIGGQGSQDYYSFLWSGGAFNATSSITGANAGASYLFSEGVVGSCSAGGTATLDSSDSFTGTIAITSLAAGQYCIGINANDPHDPAFTLTFNTPVSGVPEPATFTLVGTASLLFFRKLRIRFGAGRTS